MLVSSGTCSRLAISRSNVPASKFRSGVWPCEGVARAEIAIRPGLAVCCGCLDEREPAKLRQSSGGHVARPKTRLFVADNASTCDVDGGGRAHSIARGCCAWLLQIALPLVCIQGQLNPRVQSSLPVADPLLGPSYENQGRNETGDIIVVVPGCLPLMPAN